MHDHIIKNSTDKDANETDESIVSLNREQLINNKLPTLLNSTKTKSGQAISSWG